MSHEKDKEILTKLRVHKSKWPKYLTEEETQKPIKLYTLKDQKEDELLHSGSCVPVVASSGGEPMTKSVAVKRWFDNNPNTKMGIGEFAEFWNTLRFEDKEYISLIASNVLGCALKD